MKPLSTKPQKIVGNWAGGYSLDQHILSSEFVGCSAAGRPEFDSTRTEVGEALYQLKYGSGDRSEVIKLAVTAASFVTRWKVKIDVVVPMPPSKPRSVQPVQAVARELATQLGIDFVKDAVVRIKAIPELKNVEVAKRQKLLEGAHKVDPSRISGRSVLLLDDLFQTGATMSAVTAILRAKGGATKVYALALTRTKR